MVELGDGVREAQGGKNEVSLPPQTRTQEYRVSSGVVAWLDAARRFPASASDGRLFLSLVERAGRFSAKSNSHPSHPHLY